MLHREEKIVDSSLDAPDRGLGSSPLPRAGLRARLLASGQPPGPERAAAADSSGKARPPRGTLKS